MLNPNNSVRRVTYEPELDKYGGTEGVAIAEDLFMASTSVVSRLLRDVVERPGRRSVYGLLLLLVAAHEFGVLDAEFLERYEATWSPYAVAGGLWPRPVKEQDLRVALPCLVSVREDSRPPELDAWRSAVAAARQRLANWWGDLPDLRADRNIGMAQLLTHYVHTTNNRLGLLPADEAYLALLARTAFETGLQDG